MKALSVRAPWWWFILHAGKDIENRDWPTNFRGTVYLHASKWFSLESVADDSEIAVQCYHAAECKLDTPDVTFRQMKEAGGCIVGKVDIVDCVRKNESPWFSGDYGFVLANPVAFAQPIPCKGMLGIFALPSDVQAAIEEMERAI
jgi:hypothetical protein